MPGPFSGAFANPAETTEAPAAQGVVQPPLFGAIPTAEPEAPAAEETVEEAVEPEAPAAEETKPEAKAPAKKAAAKRTPAKKAAAKPAAKADDADAEAPVFDGDLTAVEHAIAVALVALPPAESVQASRALSARIAESADRTEAYLLSMVGGVPGDYGTFTVTPDNKVVPK